MNSTNQASIKIPLLTLFALISFAGNSVLCRLALETYAMDASQFTSIRLFSGAIILSILLAFTNRSKSSTKIDRIKLTPRSVINGFFLFAYAAFFSYAYILLDTATGALILFATVQLTMIAYQLFAYRSLSKHEVLGVTVALGGLAYWMMPDQNQPNLYGIGLMVLSGIAWGAYSIQGKLSRNAQADTAYNFLLSLPYLLLLLPIYLATETIERPLSLDGMLMAVLSGGLTSGLGYWIWYSVLPHLKISMASVLQLSVPLIAAVGGIIWLKEWPDLDFYIASVLILSGIYLVNKKSAKS